MTEGDTQRFRGPKQLGRLLVMSLGTGDPSQSLKTLLCARSVSHLPVLPQNSWSPK